MERQERKGEAFRELHEGAPFVIPNPWDAGSARVLAELGFRALASTSSGFAFTLGRPDGGATLDDVAAHAAMLDRATDLPVSVDLENGYGPDPDHAATAITRIAEAGAVGGSIEDYDPSGRLLAKAGQDEEVLIADCDLGAVDTVRTHWPFLRDRRIDAYGDLTRRYLD